MHTIYIRLFFLIKTNYKNNYKNTLIQKKLGDTVLSRVLVVFIF